MAPFHVNISKNNNSAGGKEQCDFIDFHKFWEAILLCKKSKRTGK